MTDTIKTKPEWGRFTVHGGAKVEQEIAELVRSVGELVARVVPPKHFRALVLFGGYGRSEGGIVIQDGRERPHNNLDFLLLTKRLKTQEGEQYQKQIDTGLEALSASSGIGIDLGCVSARKLRHAPCLVMWYDMRFGHKTLLGDADFLPSLTRFTAERILPGDIRWLLVNRGSQIVINDLLIARGSLSEDEKKFIIKLAIKATIGYGDALLFFLDDYHWSYQEKGRRMAKREDVPESFRRLYAEAIEFRFQPQYEAYLSRDMASWMDELREAYQAVHVECESLRMARRNWTWKEYPARSLQHGLFEGLLSLRGAAKKVINLLRGPSPPATASILEKLAYRSAGFRGLLPACFPTVMYGFEDESLRRWTQKALGARDASLNELRRAYLDAWGHQVDPNFFKVVQRYNLPLKNMEDRT